MFIPNLSLEFLVVEVDQVTKGSVGFCFIFCCGIESFLFIVLESVIGCLFIQEYSEDSIN